MTARSAASLHRLHACTPGRRHDRPRGVCPSPPLLASGVTGQDALLPELRDACAAAVGWLLAADPDTVTVIGPATATATWPPDSVPDLSMHAPAAYPGPSPLPLALAIGAQLLDAAGYSGPRILQSVAESASPGACLRARP